MAATAERREDLEERKARKKEKRSLASVRSQTRTGRKATSRAAGREVPSFQLENSNEKQATIAPRRMMDFWERFQKRQEAELKLAGVSTTGYKITRVQMLFDKNGKEKSVKVSFAGGGSIEDLGNKIQVFHDIRRKKPRFNKLYALLQAIKERGWRAVVGEIPPEMRAILLRACKQAGIPLESKAEHTAKLAAMRMQQQQQQAVNYNNNNTINKDDGMFVGEPSVFVLSTIIDNMLSSGQRHTQEYHQKNIDRACTYSGLDALDHIPTAKEAFEAEATIFAMTSMGFSHEEAVALRRNMSPEEQERIGMFAKRLDHQGDVVVRAKQLAISLDRYIKGTASEHEQAFFKEIEARMSATKGTPFKFSENCGWEAVDKKTMNFALNSVGKDEKSLQLDKEFKAESGFYNPHISVSPELDHFADILLKATGNTTTGEFRNNYPKNLKDLQQQATAYEKRRENQSRARQKPTPKKAKTPQTVERLPRKLNVLNEFDVVARYLGYSEDEIKALKGKNNGDVDKKQVNCTMSYAGKLIRLCGSDREVLLKKLNSFIKSNAEERTMLASSLQKELENYKKAVPSTLEMSMCLKKMQKRQATEKKPVKAISEKTEARQEGQKKVIQYCLEQKRRQLA